MTDNIKGKNWIRDGYEIFRKVYYPQKREMFEALSQYGQHPDVLIIACSDSRADPGMIFNSDPGDLFVIRNVANIVPVFAPDDYQHGTGAAIEFAVKVLKVSTIIVMGHQKCGGIAAHLSGGNAVENDAFLGNWVRSLDQVKRPELKPGEDMQTAMEKASVMQSLENLRGYDFIASAIKSGQTELVGAYFQIETGVLQIADENGGFSPVASG